MTWIDVLQTALIFAAMFVGYKVGEWKEQKAEARRMFERKLSMQDRVVTSSSLDNPGSSRVRRASITRVKRQ